MQMVTCLELASEQLARRSHYDFGMRAAVAVLNTAKHLFRHQPEATAVREASPVDCHSQSAEEATRHEAVTLCKALRLTNVPKLHPTDQLTFEEILRDVFDEGDLGAAEMQQHLRPFLVEAATQLLLDPSEEFLKKSLQVRWGVEEHCNSIMQLQLLATIFFSLHYSYAIPAVIR